MSIQEKFQIVTPATPEDGHNWVDPRSARTTGEAGFAHSNNTGSGASSNAKFNCLPPGQDITNTLRKRINNMPLSIAGATDESGRFASQSALDHGFTRDPMDPCSDLYHGEHIDLFYNDAVDEEGHIGFVERNNYLDRL